jgi:hypothetical protein
MDRRRAQYQGNCRGAWREHQNGRVAPGATNTHGAAGRSESMPQHPGSLGLEGGLKTSGLAEINRARGFLAGGFAGPTTAPRAATMFVPHAGFVRALFVPRVRRAHRRSHQAEIWRGEFAVGHGVACRTTRWLVTLIHRTQQQEWTAVFAGVIVEGHKILSPCSSRRAEALPAENQTNCDPNSPHPA